SENKATTDNVSSGLSSDQSRALRELSRSAMQNYNNAQDALKRGDWAKYGEFLERLKRDLDKLNEQSQKF
ncbi:MAG TPA: hypothetical protein PLN79_14970, partial [bacterium]|nr:hypothetical protein [bacterium]